MIDLHDFQTEVTPRTEVFEFLRCRELIRLGVQVWKSSAARAVPGMSSVSGCGAGFHEAIGIGVFERDRTRIVIDVTNRGYTGYEAQAILEENHIYLEMADARRLV